MSLAQKLMAITIFLEHNMTDAQAERIGDMARQLNPVERYDLECCANDTLYTILRQISAEKG
jgi:hypothetical protein